MSVKKWLENTYTKINKVNFFFINIQATSLYSSNRKMYATTAL